MPITNEAVRTGLTRLVGPYVHFVALDEVVATAFRQAGGGTTAQIGSATDDELTTLLGTQVDAFLDVGILRAVEAIILNLDQQEMDKLGIKETVEAASKRFERFLLLKARYVKQMYNIGVTMPEFGQIKLDIAQGASNSWECW